MSRAKKPNEIQCALLHAYDVPKGLIAGLNDQSLAAMVKRGWMEEISGDAPRPGWMLERRWRTTLAGRAALAAAGT